MLFAIYYIVLVAYQSQRFSLHKNCFVEGCRHEFLKFQNLRTPALSFFTCGVTRENRYSTRFVSVQKSLTAIYPSSQEQPNSECLAIIPIIHNHVAIHFAVPAFGFGRRSRSPWPTEPWYWICHRQPNRCSSCSGCARA